MATLTIEFETARMPYSTLFHRIVRAPEHLYYALLFSSSPEYTGPDPWLSWLAMGFGLALKEGPPGAHTDDRLYPSVRSGARQTLVTATSANGAALKQLGEALGAIEDVRRSGDGREPSSARALAANGVVSRLIVDVVHRGLAEAGLRPAEVRTFDAVLNRAFAALTDPNIFSVRLKSG